MQVHTSNMHAAMFFMGYFDVNQQSHVHKSGRNKLVLKRACNLGTLMTTRSRSFLPVSSVIFAMYAILLAPEVVKMTRDLATMSHGKNLVYFEPCAF